MRTVPIALFLASVLASCSSSVAGSSARPVTGSDAGAAAGDGSTFADTPGVGSDASNESGGAGPSTCTLTVTGAIDAASFTGVILADLGGALECGGIADGTLNSVLFDFGTPHGPGSYDSLAGVGYSPAYQHAERCTTAGTECIHVENFGASSAGSPRCRVHLTVAPEDPRVGDPIAGTFACPALEDEAHPDRIVAITGTFATVIQALPE